MLGYCLGCWVYLCWVGWLSCELCVCVVCYVDFCVVANVLFCYVLRCVSCCWFGLCFVIYFALRLYWLNDVVWIIVLLCLVMFGYVLSLFVCAVRLVVYVYGLCLFFRLYLWRFVWVYWLLWFDCGLVGGIWCFCLVCVYSL